MHDTKDSLSVGVKKYIFLVGIKVKMHRTKTSKSTNQRTRKPFVLKF